MDRHLPHDTARNARFFIGIVNASKMGILSAGQHTEGITFQLEAASPEDAEERYLADGDEVRSMTLSTVVESVDLAEEG